MSLAFNSNPDQFKWWRDALKGHRADFDKNSPPSGYYKSHRRSLAVWRDPKSGEIQWQMSSGYEPKHLDELCDAFAAFSMRPVSYDEWEKHQITGRWSEDPEPEIEAARSKIGHNSGSPVEVITDELEALERAFRDWLAGIGGSIQNEAQDNKAEEFRCRFIRLRKSADEAHEAEKRPFLEGGRAVDTLWKGPQERADAGKRTVAVAVTPFRVERQKRRLEEERAALDADKASVGPEYGVPKPKTGLRPHYTVEIDNLFAVAQFLCSMAGTADVVEFVAATEKVALKLLRRRVPVPGAKLHIEHKA